MRNPAFNIVGLILVGAPPVKFSPTPTFLESNTDFYALFGREVFLRMTLVLSSATILMNPPSASPASHTQLLSLDQRTQYSQFFHDASPGTCAFKSHKTSQLTARFWSGLWKMTEEQIKRKLPSLVPFDLRMSPGISGKYIRGRTPIRPYEMALIT